MSTSTEETRRQLAERVGFNTDEAELDEALGRASGDVANAALSILRTRYADALNSPAVWSVAGDYSEDRTANLKAMGEQISRLEAEIASGSTTISTGMLRRGFPLR